MLRKFCKALAVVLCVAVLALPAFGAMSDEDFLKLCRTGTAQQVADAIKAGADVNAKTNSGWTALMLAARNNQNPEIIKLLLNAGADVNAKADRGITALMVAAADYQKQPEVIKLLLEAGADVNAKNKIGTTALIFAAANNVNSEVIKTLLNAGANVNAKADNGYTVLMSAAFNKNPEVVKILLNAGADVNAKDNDGKNTLDLAREEGNTEAIKVLEAALIEQVKKSAERGDANAQYILGMAYAKGDGVPEDQWEAVVWLKKAAKQGHRDARNELARRGIYE